jgi:hypothetical protein
MTNSSALSNSGIACKHHSGVSTCTVRLSQVISSDLASQALCAFSLFFTNLIENTTAARERAPDLAHLSRSIMSHKSLSSAIANSSPWTGIESTEPQSPSSLREEMVPFQVTLRTSSSSIIRVIPSKHLFHFRISIQIAHLNRLPISFCIL